MSRSPASASSPAETLPECEPPRTRFGAPIITAIPPAREAAAAARVVGNSAMRIPSAVEAATWASVASSWLASVAPNRRAAAIASLRCRAALRSPSALISATCWRKSSSLRLRRPMA